MEKNTDYFFLANGGQSSELIRSINWTANPLGSLNLWPLSLKITLSTVLISKLPMFLWWGTDFVQLYNDAYFPLFGNSADSKRALGEKGGAFWKSREGFVDTFLHEVMSTGQSFLREGIAVPVLKDGVVEDAFYNINYIPIFDDNQKIGGVLAIYSESLPNLKFNEDFEKSRKEFDFAIEAAELGTFDLNPLTNQFTANKRLKNWFGLQTNDVLPIETAINSIAEYDRERVMNAISRAMDYYEGEQYELEYTIINAITNEERVVFAKGRADFNEAHEAIRFSGTLQDITAFKKADQEIRKSRALTDLTIKSMGIGVFTIDFKSDSIEYSPEFAKIVTGNKESIIKLGDFVKLMHAEDLPMHAKAMEEGQSTGRFFYSPRIIWKDGSVHQVAISAARLYDSKRNSKMFSGTVEDITEKEINRIALEEASVRLEKTKREAFVMFRNVTDSSPTGLWLSDSVGNITYLNKTLVEWTGLPYQTLLKDGWASAVIEEDRALSFEIFAECIKNRSHYDVLFRIKKYNNEIIWVRAAGDPFYNDGGEFVGYAGFCMDMDEIILGRKALADSEERFSLMIEQSPLAISLFTGIDMNIEIVNDAMLGYWNRDRSVLGKNLYDAMPELIGQPFLELLQNVYNSGEAFHATSAPAQILVDGELKHFYFDFNYQPIRDSKGTVYGVMSVANDVTEQVISTRKLLETRIALSGAIELAELATWRISVKSQQISYSDRFRVWLGFTSDFVSNKDFLSVVSDSNRDEVREAIEHVIETGSSGVFDIEFPIENSITSQKRIIHASARVFYDSDGSADYLSGTAQDVTKERKLQEELTFKVKERTLELYKANNELEINNQELQQFAYIASHDLQEPVRKITVFMQMLETNLESNPQKARTYIDKINNSTKRMTELIKDVLGFSELAKTARVFEQTDLNQIVGDVLNDFDLVIEQRNAKITFSDLPTVEAIPLQMSQLFGNLISNALKYSKTDSIPSINIESCQLSESEKMNFDIDQKVDYYKVEISDNGIGFDQKYADQIFNIFQRLHGKDEFAGTGIGLAMCRKILQNHNGDIVAKSAEHIGSVFTCIIPKRHQNI